MRTIIATLLNVEIHNTQTVLKYQNFRKASSVTFRGEVYQYAGFSVPNLPTSDLQLSTSDVNIVIAKNQYLDDLMVQYNDLKRSVVECFFITPGASNIRPPGFRMEVSYATREGAGILFTLKHQTSAQQGKVLTLDFNSVDFPEVNIYKPQF